MSEDAKKIKDSKEGQDKVPAGTVKAIQVEGKKAYLSNPDRFAISTALGHIMKIQGNPDWISAGEAILLQCWNGGDKELKDEKTPYFIPACMQAVSLLEAATGVLKKK